MYCLHAVKLEVVFFDSTKMEVNQRESREQILSKHLEFPDLSHRQLGKMLNIHHSTVSRVLKRFQERLTLDHGKGAGRKPGPENKKTEGKVKRMIKANPNVSSRDLAKKIGMSQSYVQNAKKRAGLHTYKVQNFPNRDERQQSTAKTRARKLYEKMLTKYGCCVMDDETYIKADFKQIPGLEFFTGKSKFDVDDKFKKKKMSKFASKYLIWQAICSCGLRSEPFVTKGTVNGEIYKSECLEKRLLPFLQQHDEAPLFWPDLASCHYSKSVLEWYEANSVHFVPKDMNPPNCPELRPVEQYWAIMKRELRKSKKTVKDEKDMLRKWKKKLRNWYRMTL